MSTISNYLLSSFKYIKNEKKNLGLTASVSLLVSLVYFFTNSFDNVSFFMVFIPVISAICFYVFAEITFSLSDIHSYLCVALSLSYGLCGFALSPSISIGEILIYALLPLLALTYTFLISNAQNLPFIALSTLFLCLDTPSAFLTFSFLLIYHALFTSKKLGGAIADFIHLLFNIILATTISAPLSLLNLEDYFISLKDSTYEGCSLIYPIFTFFSRFLSGSLPAESYSVQYGINIGIGSILIFFVVLFFFNNAFSISIRIKTFSFVMLLLLSIETSPVLFIFNLFKTYNHLITECGFLVFYLLIIAIKSLTNINRYKIWQIIVSLLADTILVILTLTICQKSLSLYSIIMNICLMIILAIFTFTCLFKNKKHNLLYLAYISCLELAFSAMLFSTGVFSAPSNSMIDEMPDFFKQTPIVATQLEAWPYTEEGNEYLSKNIALNLYGPIQQIDSNVVLTKDDILAYNPYGLISLVDEANIKCKKIGTSEPLFDKCENVEISFPSDNPDLYSVIDLGNNIFNIETKPLADNYETDIFIPFDYKLTTPYSEGIVLFDNFTNFIISCDSANYDKETQTLTGRSYIRMSQTGNFSLNVEISAYYVNQEVFVSIPDLLKSYMLMNQSLFSSVKYLVYLIAMIIGLLIVVFFTFDKDQTNKMKVLSLKTRFSELSVWNKISSSLHNNCVYILSFLLPFSLFIVSMIVFDCAPFGEKSFLDCDGISSVLGNFMNNYYNYKEGNYFLSTLGGYTNEITTTLAYPYYFVCMLFTPNQLAAVFIFTEAIIVALCGTSICYYLTHRRIRSAVSKQDYRLLFAAVIYSLNGYMLAMHSYIFWWYILFALFPLIVLELEKLLYENKWFWYTLLLSICITTNFNIAFYICIYCGLHFISCMIIDHKNLITKALRFGIFSIFSAICGFSGWAYVLFSLKDSGYSSADSVIPSPGLHDSFLTQWSKFMIFSPNGAISYNPGDINIYMGMLTLILFAIFLISKSKKKITYIFPITVLLISFNGQLLSYIWNGFHYQSNVPNRFVFIWMFILGCVSYEAICKVNELSRKQLVFVIIAGFSFIIITYFGGNTQEKTAFIVSLILLAIYSILLLANCFMFKKEQTSLVLLIILCGELFANMIFVSSSYCLDNLMTFGDLEKKSDTYSTIVDQENSFTRFAMANYYGMNLGMLYNAPTNQIFVSTIDQHTINTCFFYGILRGSNFVTSNYNSTPFGNAIASSNYIVLPQYAVVTQRDMEYYDYVGYANGDYYFKNNDSLTLGFYIPANFRFELFQSNIIPFEAYNYTACALTEDYTTELFSVLPLKHSDENTDNIFYYTDKDNNILTTQEAKDILESPEAQAAGTFCCQDMYITLSVKAPRDGELYLYLNEFVSLGYAQKGETITTTIKYPSAPFNVVEELYCFSMDTNFMQKFVNSAQQNQLYDILVDDNVIYAKSNYASDGYTSFSIPYNNNWHAYIDGVEVECEDLTDANLFVNTPAGEHEIKLVYETKNQIAVLLISVFAYLALCIIATAIHLYKKTKTL